jgi:hypothetical protein
VGLKGYRLWVMGQLESNVQIPTSPVSATSSRGRSPFLPPRSKCKLHFEAAHFETGFIT